MGCAALFPLGDLSLFRCVSTGFGHITVTSHWRHCGACRGPLVAACVAGLPHFPCRGFTLQLSMLKGDPKLSPTSFAGRPPECATRGCCDQLLLRELQAEGQPILCVFQTASVMGWGEGSSGR